MPLLPRAERQRPTPPVPMGHRSRWSGGMEAPGHQRRLCRSHHGCPSQRRRYVGRDGWQLQRGRRGRRASTRAVRWPQPPGGSTTETVGDGANRPGDRHGEAARRGGRSRRPGRHRVAGVSCGPGGTCRADGQSTQLPKRSRLGRARPRPARGGQDAPGGRAWRGCAGCWRSHRGTPSAPVQPPLASDVTAARPASTAAVRGPPPPIPLGVRRGIPATGGMIGQRPRAACGRRSVASRLPGRHRS